jgi:hypothetical protein
MQRADFIADAAAALAAHVGDGAGAALASRLGVKVAAAALFVLACVALAVLRRLLAARARTEEAEALLRDEFARLDDVARSEPRRRSRTREER